MLHKVTNRRWLFLDDSEERHTYFRNILGGQLGSVTVDHVRTAQEAIDKLIDNTVIYDCVYLDHDLEDTDPNSTGQAVAEFIALHQQKQTYPKFIVIHSWNPEGAERMHEILKPTGIPTVRKPFAV